MKNLNYCNIQSSNADQNAADGPQASLVKGNSHIKVNYTLKNQVLTNLNYCDLQASNGDQNPTEVSPASLIQVNSQGEVS